MAGESYTSPVTGETYTVPSYTDPADAPIAFKDFADTITGGGGIDIPATRVDAVVQTLDGTSWVEGMALSVSDTVPADTEGQVGDVVFVSGPSPGNVQGKVLQVVNATYSTQVGSSSATLVDTNLTATITPSSGTSKILVMFSQNGAQVSAGNLSNRIILSLFRDTTSILTSSTDTGFSSTATTKSPGSMSGTFLDSPATTSAVTYKTMFSNGVASAVVYFQVGNPSSTITLMEIAA
jgi:hypothetical protein